MLGKDCSSAVIFPKNARAEITSYAFVMKNKFGEDRPEYFKVFALQSSRRLMSDTNSFSATSARKMKGTKVLTLGAGR